MEQEIIDFDPFQPIWLLDDYYREELDSEPMTDDDWEEWLGNE